MSDTDWYLLDRGGRRFGPYDREFIEQLAVTQELLATTPVWHPGLARWQPAGRVLMLPKIERSDVPSVAPLRGTSLAPATPSPVSRAPSARPAPQRPVTPRATPPQTHTPRPAPRPATKPSGPAAAVKIPTSPMSQGQAVRRVLAALFDLGCLFAAFRLLGGALPETQMDALRRVPLLLLLWGVLDAAATVRLGFTPGKALMGIRVKAPEERNLSWPRALFRSGVLPLLLILLSLRTGFTIFVAAAALFLTAQRIRNGFAPWWDDIAGARVSYGEVTGGRIVLFALFAVVLVIVALA